MAHILKATAVDVLIATLAGGDGAQAIEFDAARTKVRAYGYVKANFFGELDTDLGTKTFGFSTQAPGFARNKTARVQAIQSNIRGSLPVVWPFSAQQEKAVNICL